MQDELIQLLAGRRGHFQMESGYHSEQWFELGRLLVRSEQLSPFVSELGRRLARHGIDAVCGPMTGGAKLAEAIASELGIGYLFAERFETSGTGLFSVEYRLPEVLREKVRGKSVAIVDDAISAGSAMRGTYADLLACGARPSAVGALFVFGDAAAHFSAENRLALECVAQMEFRMWKPIDCPLCQARLPLEKVSDVD